MPDDKTDNDGPSPQKVYQSTPDIYEHDLYNVVQVIEEIKLALGRCEDVFIESGELEMWNRNGYPIGEIRYDAGSEEWVFTPHNESDVLIEDQR